MRPRDLAVPILALRRDGATRVRALYHPDGTLELDATFADAAGFDSEPSPDVALARWTNAKADSTAARRSRRAQTPARRNDP